jgi:hypothetical protein
MEFSSPDMCVDHRRALAGITLPWLEFNRAATAAA